jgi:phage terminase large subunit-like protein
MNCPGACQVPGALRSLIYIAGPDYPGRRGYSGGDSSPVVNDTLQSWRDNRDSIWVPYDLWNKQGFIEATPGRVIDYAYILKRIDEVAKQFDLRAVLFDRWGSQKIVKDLQDMGLTVLEFGQGFASMSPPTKEMEKLILERRIMFPNNPALKWNFSNVICESDAAANLKPSKKRSSDKIDMVVASIMALDGAIRNQKKEVIPTIQWL